MKFADRAAELAASSALLLGWRPADFWGSTPAELATALGEGLPSAEQMDGAQIERLRALFPDDEQGL